MVNELERRRKRLVEEEVELVKAFVGECAALAAHARADGIERGLAQRRGLLRRGLLRRGIALRHLRAKTMAGRSVPPCRLFIVATGRASVAVLIRRSLATALHTAVASSLSEHAELAAELTRADEISAFPKVQNCFGGAIASLWVPPYTLVLAAQLELWVRVGEHPCAHLPPIAGLDEMPAGSEMDVALPPTHELAASAAQILAQLGAWGTLRLLGLRRTRLSLARAPPQLAMLCAAFHKPWRQAGSSLSVGARALSKHWHRAPESARFWAAEWAGDDSAKNALASAALVRVLAGGTWANLHRLPVTGAARSADVFEVRLASGYGARWSADGESFRGFLEPQTWDMARWVAPVGERPGESCRPRQLTSPL